MNGVTELGYLGIEATDIPAWERFALDHLGLQRADGAGDGSLALRIDDRAQRIVIEPGPADDMSCRLRLRHRRCARRAGRQAPADGWRSTNAAMNSP